MNFHPIRVVLASGAITALLTGAAAVPERDAIYGENVYVSCQWRMAAIFPGEPQLRDFTYSNGGHSAPAREFLYQRGQDRFSVVVADFTNGPAVDEALVENAAVPIRARGEIRNQFAETYDPGIPGRQINLIEPNGRQHRASVYMADHRLYITEANAPPGDFAALQFEQSISIIDANGTDLDKNVGAPSRQYECRR